MTRIYLLMILITVSSYASAQVGVNATGNPPHASAMLDVQSTSSGILFPRMTQTERNAISGPALGLTIFNLDNNCLEFFVGNVWQPIACGCSSAPGTAAAGTQVAGASQVEWNWNAVNNASGYKYHTSNDYANATDAGTNLSFTQTGLTCGGTSYQLFVWAYNNCGASSPVQLSANTDVCPFVCGSSTVSHGYVSGISPANSSPYTNTYTYPTVSGTTYIGLGAGKCWTGLNIGAIGAPTAWSDNSTQHAGWHFQFNRKQGYYQSGSGVTPSWTITSINENNNWISSNDPCTILFGAGWRIPTETEWTNYRSASVATGGMNGGDAAVAFSSPLQLHAGGSLEPSNGNTNGRGSAGRYWSSTQGGTNDLGRYIHFGSGYSGVVSDYKSTGASVRCIKD